VRNDTTERCHGRVARQVARGRRYRIGPARAGSRPFRTQLYRSSRSIRVHVNHLGRVRVTITQAVYRLVARDNDGQVNTAQIRRRDHSSRHELMVRRPETTGIRNRRCDNRVRR